MFKMRAEKLFNILKIFALTLLLCPLSISAANKQKIIDKIAAEVNGEIILKSEVENRAEELKRSGIYNKDVSLHTVLDEMIREKLISQEVKKRGLAASEDEIRRAEEQVARQNGLPSVSRLKEAVRKQGMSYSEFRQNLAKQIEHAKIMNMFIKPRVHVTDSEIRAAYNREGGEKEIHIHLLDLMLILPAQKKERGEKLALLNKLKKRAEKGADFKTLVKKYSKGPAVKTGGDLGLVPLDSLAPQIQRAVDHLKPGEISDIVIIGKTAHIFKVKDKKITGEYPFEKVKEKIKERLYEEKSRQQFENWVSDLRKKARIKIKL